MTLNNIYIKNIVINSKENDDVVEKLEFDIKKLPHPRISTTNFENDLMDYNQDYYNRPEDPIDT